MNVLIVGASRGIGFEMVRQFRTAGDAVTATARDERGLAALRALGATAAPLDVADTASCAAWAETIDGASFDTVVFNAGVYGPSTDGPQPPDAADFDAVMHTNVLGPMRVLPRLVDALAPGARLGVISSRMGSIGSRGSSAGWLYRASKAAVNSVLKDMSIALHGRAVCVALHPGWVRTDMGGAGADLSAEQSVSALRRTLAALRPADNGRFFDHDGTPIAW